MTPEQFVYWLQGFSEVANSKTVTEQQWKIIQDHLKLVFNKVTPAYPKDTAVPIPPFSPAVPPYNPPYEINPHKHPWDNSPFNPPYRVTCSSNGPISVTSTSLSSWMKTENSKPSGGGGAC